MIIPIGHESDTVRRLPWITFTIMVACLVVHIVITATMRKQIQDMGVTIQELFNYYFMHPYLELDPEIGKLLGIEDQLEKIEEFLETPAVKPDRFTLRSQQEELDRLTEKFKGTYQNIPYRKYGFIPAQQTLLGLFAYMFIHGGWLHLLGNMLFLYLSAPFIEDVWGRPLFAAFYLLMGIGSAELFALNYPSSVTPLIGASGAISGVMGAFLLRYLKTKIKFFYVLIPFIFIRGTFKAPAWMMLPLWFLLEILNARMMDVINPKGGGSVAHWAHVWGFIFGFLFALMIKYFNIEEKYIHKKIEEKISFVDPGFQIYEEAIELQNQGRREEAYAKLLDGAQKYPGHHDLAVGLWNLAAELGKEEDAASHLAKAIKEMLKKEQFEVALNHFRQLREKAPQAHLSVYFKMTMLDHLIRRVEIDDATSLANEIIKEIDQSAPLGLVMQLASATEALGERVQRKAVELALSHPNIPADKKESLQSRLNRLAEPSLPKMPRRDYGYYSVILPEEPAESAPEPVEAIPAEPPSAAPSPEAPPSTAPSPVPQSKKINLMQGVPTSLREGKLGLHVSGVGSRVLTLSNVQAIAVVRILPAMDRPFYLIDLFLDDPQSDKPAYRAVRIRSSTFDPMELVTGALDFLSAFRSFITKLLELSNARPHPDLDAVMLRNIQEFGSIEEYEFSL